ncbi:hypothetical protein AVEN_166567-1 [Araneus ventricosus]|uniref:Uncharacterized protein n=1 Tax=Araneus ventricosus TaxID=182803 RepID=A0A4Y2L0E1_ARAVE|nr:hypothetical protein AVEN_166567-1 [Araneus ventricosus]
MTFPTHPRGSRGQPRFASQEIRSRLAHPHGSAGSGVGQIQGKMKIEKTECIFDDSVYPSPPPGAQNGWIQNASESTRQLLSGVN